MRERSARGDTVSSSWLFQFVLTGNTRTHAYLLVGVKQTNIAAGLLHIDSSQHTKILRTTPIDAVIE